MLWAASCACRDSKGENNISCETSVNNDFSRIGKRIELPLPVRRHQIVPCAAQSATDSGDGGNENVDFSGFNVSDGAGIERGQFRQPLLRHFLRSANAPDVVPKFPKFDRQLSFNHVILRRILLLT